MTKLPPVVVNYRWQIQQQLTTAGSSALKSDSSIVILRVSIKKIKKIETYSESHKKFEFFDKGQIKYEFLTRLKLKTPKHQNINLEIEFWAFFL